jgi:chromosome segregation ATPase
VSQSPTDKDGEDDISLDRDIQIDGEYPDSLYEDEMRVLRRDSDIHRLSRRVTILSILIPCLLCTILVLAYLDMRQRLSHFEAMGSRKVQTLSEDVLNKAASLSDEYVKLEKASASIQDRVEKVEGNVKKLNTSKADKKASELADKKRSAEVAKTFAALREDVSQQKASLENLAKDLNQKLDEASHALEGLQTDLQKQKKAMAQAVKVIGTLEKKGKEQASAIRYLSDGKVNKEEFDNLLEKERTRAALLEKKLRYLDQEVLWLEDRLKLTGERSEVRDAERPQTQKKPAAGATESSPAPKPGKIIEQEISE